VRVTRETRATPVAWAGPSLRQVDPEVMEWLEDEHELETKGATNAP
jgi:hypothetical protein